MAFDVNKVAGYFLSKENLSPKKLQKLLYYAYAWSLALLNDDVDDLSIRLFDNKIEAWVHGPVIPEIYQQYKDYAWNEIDQIQDFDCEIFPDDVLDILNQVWTTYGEFSGNQLEEFTHHEAPWKEARQGLSPSASSSNQISDRIIFQFYNEQANK